MEFLTQNQIENIAYDAMIYKANKDMDEWDACCESSCPEFTKEEIEEFDRLHALEMYTPERNPLDLPF